MKQDFATDSNHSLHLIPDGIHCQERVKEGADTALLLPTPGKRVTGTIFNMTRPSIELTIFPTLEDEALPMGFKAVVD